MMHAIFEITNLQIELRKYIWMIHGRHWGRGKWLKFWMQRWWTLLGTQAF